MSAYFLDSSAIVKRYSPEKGTNFVISLFKPSAQHQLYVARITLVEVISALARQQRGGFLKPDEYAKAVARFRRVYAKQFFIVDIDAPLIEHASQLTEKHYLRGYDSVQLAAVLEVERLRQIAAASRLTLISADVALNNAAQIEGVLTDNPNLYP